MTKTPAAIAGAAATRLHPLRQLDKEPIGQHQVLEPYHPFEAPFQARLVAVRRERSAVVGLRDVEEEHAVRIDMSRRPSRRTFVHKDGTAIPAIPRLLDTLPV